MKNSSRFFCNYECEYFPCHASSNADEFNCLFCFCPLYSDFDCGGYFNLLSNGMKDCSKCNFPHIPENYDAMIEKIKEIQSAGN